jgi:hypothetical protein
LDSDLNAVVSRLSQATGGEVYVTDLSGDATLVVRAGAANESEAERLQRELRLRAHSALRAEGVFS